MSAKIERAKKYVERAVAALAKAAVHEATVGGPRPTNCRLCDKRLPGRFAKGRPRSICDACRKVAVRGYQRSYKRKVRAEARAEREEGVA